MKTTANLGIFQYEPLTDGKEVFSIQQALNDNWDIIDAKLLKKTGDTMTGALTITQDSHPLRLVNRNKSATNYEADVSDLVTIRYYDKNNQMMGDVGIVLGKSTQKGSYFRARTYNTKTATWKGLYVYNMDDGSAYATCPGSDYAGSILTTASISKAGNGYVKLGNGVIIQWHNYTTSSNNVKTITFPTAFTTTNYAISLQHHNSTDNNTQTTQVTEKTKTTCKVRTSIAAVTFSWIAVGY